MVRAKISDEDAASFAGGDGSKVADLPPLRDRPRPSQSFAGKVGELADELSDAGKKGAAKKTTPNDADYLEFLSLLFGFASMLFAWWLVSGTDSSRDERAALEFEEEEADAIAKPASRILARSFLGRNYGHQILGGSDYIAMAVVLAVYAERVSPYVRRKLAITRRGKAAPRPTPQPMENPNGSRNVETEGRSGESAEFIPTNIVGDFAT